MTTNTSRRSWLPPASALTACANGSRNGFSGGAIDWTNGFLSSTLSTTIAIGQGCRAPSPISSTERKASSHTRPRYGRRNDSVHGRSPRPVVVSRLVGSLTLAALPYGQRQTRREQPRRGLRNFQRDDF